MIKFIVKQMPGGGNELTTTVSYASIEKAKREISTRFYQDPEAVRYEETKFDNGHFGISLKNRANKIILQLKTVNPL